MANNVLVSQKPRVNARSPLPAGVQQLGRSLQLDPLRWSFAAYGAAPLVLLLAYDDGHANDRTLYLCFSALAMLIGGLLYTRLRATDQRVIALAAGLTLTTCFSPHHAILAGERPLRRYSLYPGFMGIGNGIVTIDLVILRSIDRWEDVQAREAIL